MDGESLQKERFQICTSIHNFCGNTEKSCQGEDCKDSYFLHLKVLWKPQCQCRAIDIWVGEVHVQVKGQADHQGQGQVEDEISVVSKDHDIVRIAKRGESDAHKESDAHSAKRGENK